MKARRLSTLVAMLALANVLRAETMREKSLRLITEDAKGGGKPVPVESRAKPPATKAFDEDDKEIVVLPKMEITESKSTKLDRQLANLEKQQAREEKASTPGWLDAILNSSLFGNSSAAARAREAQQRVEAMDWERLLLISLTEAKTPEAKARIRADIEMLKGLIR